MDARLLRTIQILALDAVENPTFDSFYRRICRWYSREFSTSLPTVEELDPLHVLETYYEERFTAAYQPDDEKAMEIYDRIKHAICFPEEAAAAEQEDEKWEEQMLRDIQAQDKKSGAAPKALPPPAEPPNTVKEALDQGQEIVMGGEESPLNFED